MLGSLLGTAQAQRSLYFDGDAAARVPTSRAQPMPMGEFTVGAWAKPSARAITSRQTIVGSYGDGAGALPWALVLRPDRTLAFDWRRPDGQWVELPGIGYGGGLQDRWYFVGAMVDTDALGNGEIRVFLDYDVSIPGVGESNLVPFSTSAAHPCPPPSFVGDGVAAHSLVMGSSYVGELDDVFLINGINTNGEIYDLVFTPLTCSQPDLVGYWRFDGSGIDSAPDAGPYGLDAAFGTPVGSGRGYPELRISTAPVPATSHDCRTSYRGVEPLVRQERLLGALQPGHQTKPVIASDGDLTAMMYSTGSAIMISTSDGRGLQWSSPRFVGGGQVRHVELSTPGDSSLFVHDQIIVAAWKDGRFDNPATPQVEYELFFNYSVDGGRNFVGEAHLSTGLPVGSGTIREFSLRGGSHVLDFPDIAMAAVFGPADFGNIGLPDWTCVWRLVRNPTPPPFFIVQPACPPPIVRMVPRIRHLAFEVYDHHFGLAIAVDPFVQDAMPGFDVFYATFDAALQNWWTWQQIDSSGPLAGDVRGMLAIDMLDQSVAIGWTESQDPMFSFRSLRARVSHDRGANFGPEVSIGGYTPGLHDVEGGDLRLLSNLNPFPDVLVAWSDDRWGIDQVYSAVSTDGGLSFRPEVGYTPIPDPVLPWPHPLPLPWPPSVPPSPWPPCLWCDPPAGVAQPPRIVVQPRIPGIRDVRGPIILWTDRAQTTQLKATLPIQGGLLWKSPIVVHEVPTLVDLERFAATFNPRYDNLITAVHHQGSAPQHVRIGGFRGQAVGAEGFALGSSRMRFVFHEPMPLPSIVWNEPDPMPWIASMLWSLTPGSLPLLTTSGIQDLGIGFDGVSSWTLSSPYFRSSFATGIGATPDLPFPSSALLGIDLFGVGLTFNAFGQIEGISDVLQLRVR